MRPRERYILGIDLGTTAMKAALFEVEQGLIGTASVAQAARRPRPGWVEQNPDEWVQSLLRVVDQLCQGLRVSDLTAIGICSQVNSHVFVDVAGRPVTPAIVWQDERCEAEAARLDASISAEQRNRWWSGVGMVANSHTVARAEWMRSNRPDLWERTHMVLSPKDFLLHQLTGQYVSDPLSSFDLVDGQGEYIGDLINLVPGLRQRLPRLSTYSDVIGTVNHPRLGGCAARVVNGTMDGFGSLFGSGAARHGEGVYISGTCEIIALISDRPGAAKGVVSFMPIDGWYVHAGPTQSGGDTLRWLAEMFEQPAAKILELAGNADRTAESPLFLPHLQGERAPLWDTFARGAFLGLSANDGGPQLALAALEGVAISARLVLRAAELAAGEKYQSLFLGGGGNRSDLWAQIRADVFGIPLKRVKCLDLGSVGAVIMAGVGVGQFDSIASASRKFVEVERTFVPDKELTARYDRMTARYLQAYEALKPVYRS